MDYTQLLIKIVPVLLQMFPRLVELVNYARNAPEEMTDQEIAERWASTLVMGSEANKKWEDA